MSRKTSGNSSLAISPQPTKTSAPTSTKTHTATAPQPKTAPLGKAKEYALVLYDFDSTNSDELEVSVSLSCYSSQYGRMVVFESLMFEQVREGMRVGVLQKSDLKGNGEWWQVQRHDGAFGEPPQTIMTSVAAQSCVQGTCPATTSSSRAQDGSGMSLNFSLVFK